MASTALITHRQDVDACTDLVDRLEHVAASGEDARTILDTATARYRRS